MNGSEDQSTDTTVIPPEPASAPGPTSEQLSDMPSAQLPPVVRRAQLVKQPPPPAAPGPAPTAEQLSDMPQGATPRPPSGPAQFGALANARGAFVQELANNPNLRRKLMASTNAEVGDQNDAAKQAYIESVMNRAVARNQSLDATISSKAYYPRRTIKHLGDPVAQTVQDNLNPMIDQALHGSNTANFATGNQSPPVKSGGAPIAFDPQTGRHGETFVLENQTADKNWAASMKQQQAHWQQYGQPTAPAVNVMGAYGQGKGSAAEPGVGDEGDLSGLDQTSLQHLGGAGAAINA